MVVRFGSLVLAFTALACASSVPGASSAWVTNASRKTQCAEEDNVYVKLSGEGLTGMRIEARQPSYIAQLKLDDSKADFSHCNFSKAENPVFHSEPKRLIVWQNERYVLVGNTYESFWRPANVDVVVHGQVTQQIHLLQLHLKDPSVAGDGYEFLVFYPPDGYWRAKPIPHLPMMSSTYGTSFLVGPVKEGARPTVDLTKVEFVPERMTFVMDYADGSRGEMHLAEVNRDKVVLEYTNTRAFAVTQPMAAIRSMFVSPERSDVAEVILRDREGVETLQLPEFTRKAAVEVSFGRSIVSTHNPSAPDMWFGAFVLAGEHAQPN